MATAAAIFMLYGIPHGDLHFSNRSYRRYLRSGMVHLARRAIPTPVHFAGEATDPSRPHLKEATYALHVLDELGYDNIPDFPINAHLAGRDAREALEHIALYLDGHITEVIVFCAWTHQDHVHYLAKKILGNHGRRVVTIVGIQFPHDIGIFGSLWGRLSRLPRLALAVGAWHSEAIREFEWRLRLRHMRKCAMYPNKLPPIT